MKMGITVEWLIGLTQWEYFQAEAEQNARL